MNQNKEETVIGRWSRRKIESGQKADAERAAPTDVDGPRQTPPAAEPDNQSADKEGKTPAPLTDADMPAIETLTEDSDYSGFMSTGVSDNLRNLALRKLFKTPFFNVRDGLDEYDEDYSHFEKLGDIVTCDMKHQIELEEAALAEESALKANELDDEVVEEPMATDESIGIETAEESATAVPMHAAPREPFVAQPESAGDSAGDDEEIL